MNFSKVFLGFTGCLLAASLSGCVVVADSGSGLGDLTVDLTIEGTNDPTICDDPLVLADEIDWTLVDDTGRTVKSLTTSCGVFSVTFADVPEGFYSVEISLADAGATVSDTLIVDDIDVVEDTEVVVPADMPVALID